MAYSHEFRIIKAAQNVGKRFPYYSPAVVRARFIRDDSTPTLNINCNLVISYNNSYISKLTDYQLEQDILHEILHYINGHHERYMNNRLRDTLPFYIHNVAMDIEVNEFIPDISGDAYKAKSLGFPERKSYEEYLELISKDMPPKLENLSQSPRICDLNMDGYSEDYKQVLSDLVSECEKKTGTQKTSGSATRKISKRKFPWEHVFQNIITAKVTELMAGFKYRTFEKANRRYAHIPGVIFPQFIDRKSNISLAVIMDISGSMGNNTNKMYGVMKSMIDILDIQIEITVLEVNTGVKNIMYGFDLKKESFKGKSGGGTNMGAGLVFIRKNKMNPDLIVIMTDSYTPWPHPPVFPEKAVVLTDNPDHYNGPYPMYPVVF